LHYQIGGLLALEDSGPHPARTARLDC
jgi:hypothetical protein